MRDISEFPNLPYLPLLNEKIVRIIMLMSFINRKNKVASSFDNKILQLNNNLSVAANGR